MAAACVAVVSFVAGAHEQPCRNVDAEGLCSKLQLQTTRLLDVARGFG